MSREKVNTQDKKETINIETNKDEKDEETMCPECDGKLRMDGNEYLCVDCGYIVETKNIDRGPEWRAFNHNEKQEKSRVGAPTTKTMHEKGLTTNIDWKDKDAYGKQIEAKKRTQMIRLRKWQERIRTKDAGERNLQFALSELDRMASALGIPDNTREVGSIMYRRALEEDLIRGRSIEGVVTACLYAACRKQGIPRSLEEIEEVSRVDRKEIGRTYRYVSKALGEDMKPVDPKQYVSRYCSELGLSETVKTKAMDIIDVTSEKGLLSGKSPTGFAAAAIYAAALLCNEKRTQKEVADVAQVTEVTIRNRYQEQIDALDL